MRDSARTDMNGFIDTDGVNAPDGVMGPHREKEGSFYAYQGNILTCTY